MYLKEVIASGFKSFADKLDIKLDDKTTCIVGPNGSGKSNVVDAVRWVLGEQSIKSLRGESSMTDVIFSGSKSRNPLNVASVELIFDNSDHFLNVPYTEISIKRKVYRNGENEYYLNTERCRLKDISNLLLDTGMGKESFNIISQGEVDQILSNSPLDRRVIFEEAAGILKYKRRKEEALRKLDRTHNNLDRVNDIIGEIELQIAPLKEQSLKATEYLENKKGLDNYEVALLAYDIEDLNFQLEEKNRLKEKIEKEILSLSAETNNSDITLLELNNELEKLENKKNDLNKELLIITEEVEKINGEKNLLKERSKTTKKDNQLNDKLRILLEEKANLERQKEVINTELSSIAKSCTKAQQDLSIAEELLNKEKQEKVNLEKDYSKLDQELISIKHKIEFLKAEIEESADTPNSVKSILHATNLNGIHNTIGNIVSIDEKYLKALNIALLSNRHFIITADEKSSKQAISYLKDHHLGRATFFPLSIIKSRYIDSETLNILQKSPDYIGVLSDFIIYNNKYKNIIENQFGTVILTEDIDSATRLSHLIQAKYKIITLDGDVVNVGGSMSGGSSYKVRSVIMTKQELKVAEGKTEQLENELKEIVQKINTLNIKISKLEETLYLQSKNKMEYDQSYEMKNNELQLLIQKLDEVSKEWENYESIKNNSVDEKEKELIKQFHKKSAEKEKYQILLNDFSKQINDKKTKIEELEALDKIKNSSLRNCEKQLNELEITINRLDVKIGNMLDTLSVDYELTFEKAKTDYKLDIEPEEAREKVSKYRANIKRIGMVNLDSIEEYERVNTRYEFLTNQREDLLKAENTLLEIMNEMDDVMKEEFKMTFASIKTEFQKVFKTLFGGGSADLKLTDPTNLLTTGVEIVASPPGKKLTTISLLSGGEKTLTAISLLFAILNVRPTPFCLFDEVEAALDEANVAKFGEYLNNYKNKTQFLIITHKKKTMEYANTLYGITMQESGVSKLVSVKLIDKVETL